MLSKKHFNSFDDYDPDNPFDNTNYLNYTTNNNYNKQENYDEYYEEIIDEYYIDQLSSPTYQYKKFDIKTLEKRKKEIEKTIQVHNFLPSYYYLCGSQILKEIYKLLNTREKYKLLPLIQEYNQLIPPFNQNTDYIWSLVTTTLLMNEKLCGENKIHNLLNDKDFFYSLEDIIIRYENDLDDSYYNPQFHNYFLDENNLIVSNFFQGINGYAKETGIGFGCNNSIINNDTIDYVELVKRVRNSLAHSNYEVLNSNHLRLYHYNEKTNTLDFNIIINKALALTIIDELNYKVKQKYNFLIHDFIWQKNDYRYKNNITEQELINYLLSLNFMEENECRQFVDIAKTDKDFINLTSFDKIQYLCEKVMQKYTSITHSKSANALHEILFSYYKNDPVMSEFIYHKEDLYKEILDINYTYQKQEILKLLITSFLNISLLNGFNNIDNKKYTIDFSKIDFSNITLDKNTKEQFINSRYKSIFNNYNDLTKIEKQLTEISKKIKQKLEILTTKYRANNYFINILPTEIENLKQTYNLLYNEYQRQISIDKEELYSNLFEIIDINNNHLDKNIAATILEHLRNSLAHGNIVFPSNININNIFEEVLVFEDYNPQTKELTFKGQIKFSDIFNLLTNPKVIKTIMNINYSKTKKR